MTDRDPLPKLPSDRSSLTGDVQPSPMPRDTIVFRWLPGRPSSTIHDGDNWYPYGKGYRLAAEIVAWYVRESGGWNDYLLYPVCFLYRHYVELRLKEILRNGGTLVDEDPSKPRTHNLQKLWSDARPLLLKIWPPDEIDPAYREESDAFIAAMDSLVSQLHAIDPRSDAFRYPVTTEDSPSLPGVRALDIGHVAACFDSVAAFLDGSVLGIDDQRDMRNQWLGEIERENGGYE
jgi:hypothetical protein